MGLNLSVENRLRVLELAAASTNEPKEVANRYQKMLDLLTGYEPKKNEG